MFRLGKVDFWWIVDSSLLQRQGASKMQGIFYVDQGPTMLIKRLWVTRLVALLLRRQPEA